MSTRRDFLSTVAAGLALGSSANLLGGEPAEAHDAQKVYRIGVISARINGKPQPTNGHTWHFAQYLHPTINLDAIRKYLDPGSITFFEQYLRNPRENFGTLPFADTRITHYYEADPQIAARFTEAFPGVEVATSVERMAADVDAVWLGDASGDGTDHFDLVAPGLSRGLPTFCDKPIGGSVDGTRKILEFAQRHRAPLMSSSLFRHEMGMEEALRLRDGGQEGPLQYVIASLGGGFSADVWAIYGQHPVWTVMTLLGPGAEAVNLYAREHTAHALITYPDRMPAEVWYGRPDIAGEYCSTAVHFLKRKFEYTPSIGGNFRLGHHYEMFNMARAFRDMVRTGREPVPHPEILEVTAIIQAAAKSLSEKSRFVPLAEVMG
ncbi:MAG TPA: Gfo/Idh/MocA family oxidoreductase [Pirellulales bacterium]|nr:Gfo/Idh/MocA family oxidoreductase [Pirellulales bacterium]